MEKEIKTEVKMVARYVRIETWFLSGKSFFIE